MRWSTDRVLFTLAGVLLLRRDGVLGGGTSDGAVGGTRVVSDDEINRARRKDGWRPVHVHPRAVFSISYRTCARLCMMWRDPLGWPNVYIRRWMNYEFGKPTPTQLGGGKGEKGLRPSPLETKERKGSPRLDPDVPPTTTYSHLYTPMHSVHSIYFIFILPRCC